MKHRSRSTNLVMAVGISVMLAGAGRADEGMWLYNHPPKKLLKEKYNFDVTPEWLEHLQKSSVRFNNGGSGSFVSSSGLVFTNHHVGADCIHKLSTADKDYLETGFYAALPEQERKCPDLELNVLMSIEDVTGRVNSALKPGMDAAASQAARRAVMNVIEKESLDETGLRSDVVTLYNGGEYHLYRFKKYTDVRLVFAPEKAIAFFGGDADNFEYPRYDLDITFFRAYEQGKPAKVEHYLKWSTGGAKEGALVFVSGHPGRTERLDTLKHLEFLRDRASPFLLNVIRRREVLLRTFSERSLENARRAEDELFSLANSRKARLGMLAGLQDPALMAKKQAEEKALRESVATSAELKAAYGGAWDEIESALKAWNNIFVEHYLWERAGAFRSDLFEKARELVRLAEETRKPNAARLREYSEAGLDSLKQELFSEAPIYDDLETVTLADSLSMMVELAGADNEFVRKALEGKSPRERAAELIDGTKLKDAAVRRKLAEGGQEAIEASEDPMILLARLVDGPARRLRKIYDEQVEEQLRQGYGKIAMARFKVYGSDVYPDATFTLRLAFGEVKGYEEDGRRVPWATKIGGTFGHAADHQYRDPFNLPKSWLEGKDRLNPATPLNFVNTADIIGGNSGSPVVTREGEVAGIIFDMNLPSLVYAYVYTDHQARAVAVHSAGILEALRKVYRTNALLTELTAGRN